ncbi:glycosyltransferase family 2 protein [Sphingobacterium spiritivorum]
MINNSHISVITPIYNASKYISKSATSLFEQTLEEIEYVFVDDCSKDRSIEILEHLVQLYPLRKDRVKIIKNPENKGVAFSRNIGLKAASGKYIAWVDADDYIDVDMLRILYEKAELETADLVWCDFYKISENYKIENQQAFEENVKSYIIGLVTGDIQGMLWNKLIRREIFTIHNIEFLEGYNMGEDRNVLLKVIYYCQKMIYVNEALYYYNLSNTESVTQNLSTRAQRVYEDIYNVKDLLFFLEKQQVNWIDDKDINDLKFRVKQKLLHLTSVSDFFSWKREFSEVNRLVYNYKMPFRHRLLGICTQHNLWWVIRIWIFFKTKNNKLSS